MKSWKTTIVGAALAALLAVEPLLTGVGYHLDRTTITKLVFAGLVAVLGYLAKDADVTGTK
jgi:hypothetical protein